jgi:hypothetical protein
MREWKILTNDVDHEQLTAGRQLARAPKYDPTLQMANCYADTREYNATANHTSADCRRLGDTHYLHVSFLSRSYVFPLRAPLTQSTEKTKLTSHLPLVGINNILLTVLGFLVGLSLSFRGSTAYERLAPVAKDIAISRHLLLTPTQMGRWTKILGLTYPNFAEFSPYYLDTY